MTIIRTVFVLAALMIGFSLPTLATHAAERGTPEEAKALVAKAIAAFKEKGPAVFDEINAGGFRDRDLYVFVYATGDQGKVVAYGGAPVDPPILGRPKDDIKDADGLPLGKMFEEKATPEGVWVDYRWKHPESGEVADKSSWVVRSGDYIFGCGVYKQSPLYRDVTMAKRPHDCDFWTAPMGQKHCSYEPEAYPYSLDGRRGVYVTWGKVED